MRKDGQELVLAAVGTFDHLPCLLFALEQFGRLLLGQGAFGDLVLETQVAVAQFGRARLDAAFQLVVDQFRRSSCTRLRSMA